MAERFRELVRPTLVDLGSRTTPSGSAQAAATLADALSSFSRAGSDVAGKLSAQVGAKEGAAAGLTEEPGFRRNLRAMSAYGRAYNDAALRSYAIKSEADLEEQAARLETEAGTNPEAFRTAMDEMQKSVIEEAPEEARPLLAEAYTRRTSAGLARIQSALATELRNEDRGLIDEQVSRSIDRVSFLRSLDTPEAAAQADEDETKLNMLIDGAVNDGTLSESEGRIVRESIRYNVIAQTVSARFKNELESPYGDPVGFLQDLKDLNRTAEVLPPEKEAELENALLAELRERNALRSLSESQEVDEVEARHAAGDRQATTDLLAGELSQGDLLTMIQADSISPQIARTLLNELQSSATRPAKSDPKRLFEVETNLLSMTEEEVATDQGLTWDDRSRLILKRRDDEAGWKGTQAAREAIDRIDRALGIAPGTNRNMLTEEEAVARDLALTDFYDRIDALPPEERQAALISTSQEVIRLNLKNQAATQLDAARANLAEYRQRMGDPNSLNGSARRRYDEEIRRYENTISVLEQKVQQ